MRSYTRVRVPSLKANGPVEMEEIAILHYYVLCIAVAVIVCLREAG